MVITIKGDKEEGNAVRNWFEYNHHTAYVIPSPSSIVWPAEEESRKHLGSIELDGD